MTMLGASKKRTKAALPFGTQLLDRMALLHPRTWQQIKTSLQRFVPNEIALVTQSFFGMVLPAIAWGLVYHLLLATTASPLLLSATYFVSPWSISCGNSFRTSAQQPIKLISDMTTKRALTLLDAHQVLAEQLEQGRAYRLRQYDVYLPALNDSSNNSTKAIILVPGALVDHTAYSEIVTQLSNRNLLVVVVSCEPTRLADFLTARQIQRIRKQVENSSHTILDWTICGHSLGARRAVELGVELGFSNIIMWAFPYYTLPVFLNLEKKQKLYLVQGGNDPGVSQQLVAENSTTRRHLDSFRDFTSNLPNGAQQAIIEGGSHQYFGSYTPGFFWGPADADAADVSRQEHHRQLADLTAKFVLKD
jgi:hypothetical protein